MLRSLTWYWRTNLAVVAGAAVATAVLTGALVVGDSVRGSLRSLTLDRLGGIDLAIAGERPLPLEVVRRLEADPQRHKELPGLAPVLSLRATAIHADSRALASGVSLWGVDGRFLDLFGAAQRLDFERRSGQPFPALVINEALARELGATVGDAVIVSFASHSEIPRESLLGSSDPDELIDRARYQLTGVIPDRGLGGFGLQPHQSQPLNAFAELSQVGRAMGAEERFNVLLAGGGEIDPQAEDQLSRLLGRVLAPEDAGLRLSSGDDFLTIESGEFVLRAPQAALIERTAQREGAEIQPLLTYLANALRVDGREIPYSTVTALPLPVAEPFGRLGGLDGSPVVSLDDERILLGSWAAEELGAAIGDQLEMDYYAVGPGDQLETATARFVVGGIVPLEGLAADPRLAPEFPGISDAARMSAWDPPFPVDLGRIRPQDEEYWEQFRGTPKAFLSLAAGQRLWRSRFGDLSAIRIARPEGQGTDFDRRFARLLADGLGPEALGYRTLGLKRRGLEAASGASDFSGLFLAFSFVLIASAALLVGLLFRLAVEQRVGEVGLRLALGFPGRSVMRTLVAEGAVLAALGALLGCALAVIYAWLLLRGIGSWWSRLISASLLELHLSPVSLLAGAAGSVILVVIVQWLAIRRLRRSPVRALLGGATGTRRSRRSARRPLLVAAILAGIAIVLLILSVIVSGESSPALFFTVAGLLLGAGLASFAAWCRGARGGLGEGGWSLLPAMAAHNSARSPGRSLLSVVLVACASFLLVSLEAVRKDSSRMALTRDSGTGGFALLATADTPLRHDLGDPKALAELGLSPDQAGTLGTARFFPLRARPGEDASCLNLYQPETPGILGVPQAMIDRGGFAFFSQLGEAGNPWELLSEPLEPGVIAAIGDHNSMQWILHLGLGQELSLVDDYGETVRLRLVGLLQSSIFQSELLISEAAFLRHFPSHGGYGYLLVEAPEDRSAEVRRTLESGLSLYGLDVTSAPERLAAFQAVENTYLTTFQVLGGLGLLLGTVGLAVVMVRNILERRKELAALRAFGYRRRTLAWMVLFENAFLLVVGLGIGTVSGLAAVTPHLLAGSTELPWSSLALTFAAILAAGLLAGGLAVAGALRTPLIPVLKAE